ncbi:putative F-box protein At1g12855 [Actinidia eriantha]|uniref:putative F-box protein At1g12855 n=1 Tax=Actinidia eriantha TaxID=165200 RepID=UPI002587CA41|nr:putative F-box protein At1g12855 [Actinidia eriantha]
MEYFPRDVVIDILARLAAKDLCTCRCVSKQWLNLISDPSFKKLHFHLSKKKPRLLFVTDLISPTCDLFMFTPCDDGICDYFSLNITCEHTFRRIFGSDLICVIDGRAVYVSNPSIHEVARLPDWNHSSLSTAGVGLGYLASMNEYKIVQFYYLNDQGFNYEVGVEIYTLKDGRPNLGFWRKVEIFPSMRMLWVEYSVVANGGIYWLFTEEVYGEEKIVSMDLENEDFMNIRCPEVCIDVDKGDKTSLIELKGFLCFAHFSQKDSVMNLWMLKDQETHFWLKEYTIDFRGIPGSYTGLGYVPWDDHVGEISIYSSKENRLLFYNIENKRFRRVKNRSIPVDKLCCVYFDTMFSLQRR